MGQSPQRPSPPEQARYSPPPARYSPPPTRYSPPPAWFRRRELKTDFNSLVFYAAKRGSVDHLRDVLRTHGHLIDEPNPDEDNQTPLHAAASCGRVDAIEVLVQHGSRALEAQTDFFSTPAYVAITHGHVPAFETLARLGSRLDASCAAGWTLVHMAVRTIEGDAFERVARLCGPDVIDRRDSRGETPLHLSVSDGNVSALESLVRLGSQVIDAPNAQGWTPLRLAAASKSGRVIEALVRLGSKAIDTPDREGITPLAAALSRVPRSDCVQVLLALGATHGQGLIDDLTDEDVLTIRHRVYFARSLTDRLLFRTR